MQVQAAEVHQAEEVVLGPAKRGYQLKGLRSEEPLLTVAMESRFSSQLNTQVGHAMCLCHVCMNVICVVCCLAQQVGSAAVRGHCGTNSIQEQLGG